MHWKINVMSICKFKEAEHQWTSSFSILLYLLPEHFFPDTFPHNLKIDVSLVFFYTINILSQIKILMVVNI